MIDIRALARLTVAAALLALPALRAQAQDTPPRQLPPASPPPPAPEAVRVPVPPPENAVALCNDQSFVLAPATPSACAARGGLKVVLPRRVAPATPAPAQPAQPAQQAQLQAAPAPSATPPTGATMRCNDGTWLTGPAAAARCDANGGLLVILPTHTPPPPPARRP